MVLGTTNRRDSLDESLRRPGRLDKEVEIPIPSPQDRVGILTMLFSSVDHSLMPEDISNYAAKTHGFVGADLQALCSEAAMCALRRYKVANNSGKCVRVSPEDVMAALTRIRPSALREFSSDPSSVTLKDVGGNEKIKQQLKEVIEWPLVHQKSLTRIGAVPPKGILLCGPPGCSKTLLVKAVAGESQLNFFPVKGPELISKFVGESEKSIKNIFEKARRSSPAILFFDEIDGLVGTRAEKPSLQGVDVSDRVLSQLLQELDGYQNLNGTLIVIAATNRPDRLDKALLRPGRFDRVIEVPLPSLEDRAKILEIHTRNIPTSTDIKFSELAGCTEGFSGADLASICQKAAMRALTLHDKTPCVQLSDFKAILEEYYVNKKSAASHFSDFVRSV